MTFGSDLSGGSQNRWTRNQDSTVVILKLQSTAWQNQKLIKETVNWSSYEKFRKILNRYLAEPFKS